MKRSQNRNYVAFLGLIITGALLMVVAFTSGMIQLGVPAAIFIAGSGIFHSRYTKEMQAILDKARGTREEQLARAEKAACEMYDILTEKAGRDALNLTLVDRKPGILDSKIGGAYFVPEGLEQPIDKESTRPLALLVQLNFARLPQLEGFPEDGMLQIFISGDDLSYGYDFSAEDGQSGWCARYLEAAQLPEAAVGATAGESDAAAGDGAAAATERDAGVPPERIFFPNHLDGYELPFDADAEFALEAELVRQPISRGDQNCEKVIFETCPNYFVKSLRDGVYLDDDIHEALVGKLTSYQCQVGGYAQFQRVDPRHADDSGFFPDALLFQMSTLPSVNWGENGVANFFTSSEDLARRDFSRAIFNWD